MVGVNGLRREPVGRTALERPSSEGRMGQRLEDDVLVIEENDIAVSEAFDDQPSWTMFRLEARVRIRSNPC